MVTVSKLELDQAQLVVMNNNAEVQPYITDHMELLQSMVPRNQKNKQKWVADQHRQTFIGWLRNTIIAKLNEPNHGVSDVLSRIALGPTFAVAKHEAYIVRGKRFHTKSRDDAREVQNSGIRIVAETMHFASAKDRNPVLGTMTYYGVIEEIWELNYFAFRIPLFKCSWVDNNVGVKTDELGFTLVDLSKRGSKNDPFIMASQAAQVFYISDPANDKWSIVLSTPERRFLEAKRMRRMPTYVTMTSLLDNQFLSNSWELIVTLRKTTPNTLETISMREYGSILREARIHCGSRMSADNRVGL
ncbi:uncharacterized protein LOC133034576 [Cannabis sativa]|uniref:uncharacterized protein LOC133034576 n=1 Tax=Cannabis sativa TaxID=3483 RepID=UPI0029CA3985|nr:uncharacterized protein LOC133034576 [Cannabis sativa]